MSKTNKEIYYIIGAFGCGKSTAVKTIADKRDNIFPILEGYTEQFFMNTDHVFMRQFFAISVLYYKLFKALHTRKEPIILVDGHPMQGLFYNQAFFEMESGYSISYKDILYLGRFHFQMVKHFTESVKIPQTVIFINLPYEKHEKMVFERLSNRQEFGLFLEEKDPYYLRTIRAIFQAQAKGLAEGLYQSEFIEVNSLDDVEKHIQ